MNTGGNAGGQSSVTIIRGLSLDEISSIIEKDKEETSKVIKEHHL